MIEDKNTTTDEDFEKMLNDFILGEYEKTSSTDENNGDGQTADTLPQCYTFKTCAFGVRDVELLSLGRSLVYSEHDVDGDSECYVAFLDIRNDSTGQDRKKTTVLVKLYRKGQKTPIYIQKEEDPHDIVLDIRNAVGQLKPGDYYVETSNLVPQVEDDRFRCAGTSCRLDFTVQADCREKKHPEIVGVQTWAPASARGRLTIILRTSEPVAPNANLGVICYNSSLTLMSRQSCRCIAGNMWRVDLASKLSWTDDDYLCVVLHGDTPFHKITVSAAQQQRASFKDEPIDQDSDEYLMIQDLETNLCGNMAEYWQALRSMVGFRALKQRAVALYRERKHNEERRSMGLKDLPQEHNMFISCQPVKAMEELIGAFAKFTRHHSFFRYVDAATLVEQKNTPDPYEELTSLLDDSSMKTICLYNVGQMLHSGANVVLQRLEQRMQMRNFTLFLMGLESELEQLREMAPGLCAYFPKENRLAVEPYTVGDIVHKVEQMLSDWDLWLSDNASQALTVGLERMGQRGELGRWDATAVEQFVRDGIVNRFRQRVMQGLSASSRERQMLFLRTVEAADIDWATLGSGSTSFEESMRELQGMVGLKEVKQGITAAFNRIRFNALRRQKGCDVRAELPHHMIFMGNPGTGKTTVAKQIGRIYHALGLLSKGDVIVTERGRMVGRFIGETERIMQSLLQQARGNVLFIDEAYTLCDTTEDRKDFGYHVIECLLTVLAQKQPDMLVIMAGYQEDMERMLQANQGLKGRFPNVFIFQDYTADELMQIARGLLSAEQYTLSPAAEARLRETVVEAVSQKGHDFSNARWMEQYVSGGIIPAMADRIVNHTDAATIDQEICQRIELADVEQAWQLFRPTSTDNKNARKPVIGFCA